MEENKEENKFVEHGQIEENEKKKVEKIGGKVCEEKKHYCYVLTHKDKPRFTYNGYTCNPKRRIRQHNQELVGGAWYTKKFGVGWNYLIIINSDELSYKQNLKIEYAMKYPTRKKPRPKEYQGEIGRLKGLANVLANNEKFTCLQHLNIYINKTTHEKILLDIFTEYGVKTNITIHELSDILT